MIFNDPDAEWTDWDFKLVKALVIYEDYKAGTGVPMYWDRSDRVRFEVGSYTSRSKAALDRKEEQASKQKTPNYGKIFYPIPVTVDGGPLPTLQDFLDEQEHKRQMSAGNIRIDEDSKFSNAGWKPKDQGILLG